MKEILNGRGRSEYIEGVFNYIYTSINICYDSLRGDVQEMLQCTWDLLLQAFTDFERNNNNVSIINQKYSDSALPTIEPHYSGSTAIN